MKHRNSLAQVALAVGIVLGLTGPISAGEQVPFKGSLDGMRVSQTPLDPPFVLNTIAACGNATHLGKYELVISNIVNVPARTGAGTFEFVAANGDTLTAEFVGTSVPSGTAGVNLVMEYAIITGGTGRFAGASGSFVVERLFEPATQLTSGMFEGSISPPGR